MGFFDVLMGKPSSSQSSSGPVGGAATEKMAKDIAYGTKTYVLPYQTGGRVSQTNIDRFTPMGETADEASAFQRIRQGFAPTAETLSSDIGMFMNPYNQYVIDEMNREAGGEYSILKQALTEAGQMGSNRQNIGAGDIDIRREGQIGQFLQDQYNTSMGLAMNQLPALRMQDVSNLLGIGEFQRALDLQTKQAPVTALQTGAGILSQFPTTQSSSATGESGGLLDKISNFAVGMFGA